MGLAEYKIVPKGRGCSMLHDEAANNDYASKEAAFESAVAAASLALREGHEVRVSVLAQERSRIGRISVRFFTSRRSSFFAPTMTARSGAA
jgi:hypothetical protein